MHILVYSVSREHMICITGVWFAESFRLSIDLPSHSYLTSYAVARWVHGHMSGGSDVRLVTCPVGQMSGGSDVRK